MTGAQIISLAREYLNEPVIYDVSGNLISQFYVNDRLLGTANLIYNNLNVKTKFNVDNTNITISSIEHNSIPSVATIGMGELPADFMCIDQRVGVRWYNANGTISNHRLNPNPWIEAEWGNQGVLGVGEPRWYFLYQESKFYHTVGIDRVIFIMPAPETSGLKALHIGYVARPADITETTSPVFAPEFHSIIVHKLCEIYLVKNRNFSRARYHTVKYKSVLSEMTDFYADQTRENGAVRRKSVYGRSAWQ